MTGPGEEDFFEHFIDDFFAECDEHLATARRVLLALEMEYSDASAATALLQELFRTMHTLKGLSGMVGLSSAERVAHVVEDCLRAVQKSAARFDATLVDALLAAVDLLERCIAARRTGDPAPDTGPVLDALVALSPVEAPAPLVASAETGKPAELPTGEARIYHVEFVPSIELTQRGVGVESVRTRLRMLGDILDAKPRIAPTGIAFDFRVAAGPGLEPDAEWAADGMSWTIEPAPPVASADAGGRRVSDTFPVVADRVAPAQSASVVRVDLPRLDAVMRLVGDLVVSRSRLEDLLKQAAQTGSTAAWDGLEETNEVMERQLRRLREGIMRIRLVPVAEVFERLRYAVRDAARESGRQVALELHGQQTEIDKLIVDRMLEPLLHLVRNAVSHGIEPPEVRIAAGKPAQGRVTLRAAASGDRIIVQVEDDGAGIDVAQVERRARSRGLLPDDEHLGPAGLLDVLCESGFSTREGADMTSGRGVGMDVVRSAVRALAGDITLDTQAGVGTRFVISLPLTLMIVDALMVEVGGQQMAVPQPVLREILQVDASTIVPFENNQVVAYRGGVLPLLDVARVFRFPVKHRAQVYLLVVGTDSAPMGLIVDRLMGLREIVVHPVVDPLVSVRGISGATELGDGRVSLILDSAAIVSLAHEQGARGAPAISRVPSPAVSFMT